MSPDDPMHKPLTFVHSRMSYSGPEDPPPRKEWVVDIGAPVGVVAIFDGYNAENLAHRLARAYLDPSATRRTVVEQRCICMRDNGARPAEVAEYRRLQGIDGPPVCEWCAETGHPQSCSPSPEYRPATTTRAGSRVCAAHAKMYDDFKREEDEVRLPDNGGYLDTDTDY